MALHVEGPVAEFWPQRARFNSKVIYVRFVREKIMLRPVSL